MKKSVLLFCLGSSLGVTALQASPVSVPTGSAGVQWLLDRVVQPPATPETGGLFGSGKYGIDSVGRAYRVSDGSFLVINGKPVVVDPAEIPPELKDRIPRRP